MKMRAEPPNNTLLHTTYRASTSILAGCPLGRLVHSSKKAIDYKRDFGYDYFGFKTLEKSYLLKVNGCSAGCGFLLKR